MTREEIVTARVQELIKNHERYTFPKFLYLLRNNLRLTRSIVSEETDLSEFRIMCLELGRSIKNFKMHEIIVLSDYYNVPFDVMFIKAKDFFNSLERKKAA